MITIGSSKRSVGDLAVMGGPALFDEALPVGRPNVGDRARLFERLEQALDRRVLSNAGPLSREFEERIAEISGVKRAVAIVNATIALQITARALGLQGEVIVPSFTFVGTAHALAWIGLQPVFCDIGADSPTIDPDMVERLIGPQTSAILGVHLWGRTCDVDRLHEISTAHGIPVVYDAAHAFGCSRGGRPVGSFGAAEVFSFHATKFINAFEGGAICTHDEDLAWRCRRMRDFGFLGWDHTESVGTNGKMHEATAAMGLTSLEAMSDILALNRRNARLYATHLADIDGLRLMPQDEPETTNAQYIVVRVEAGRAGLERDDLQRVLLAENVLARRYFYPGCHRLAPYAERPDLVREPLVNTEALADEVLVLPTGTTVGEAEIAAICEVIRFSLANGPAIEPHLAAG